MQYIHTCKQRHGCASRIFQQTLRFFLGNPQKSVSRLPTSRSRLPDHAASHFRRPRLTSQIHQFATPSTPTPPHAHPTRGASRLLFKRPAQAKHHTYAHNYIVTMSRSLELKQEGNRHFQNGDYIGAEGLYSKAYVPPHQHHDKTHIYTYTFLS